MLEFQCNKVDLHRALRLCGLSVIEKQVVHQFPCALHQALLLLLVLLLMKGGDIPLNLTKFHKRVDDGQRGRCGLLALQDGGQHV